MYVYAFVYGGGYAPGVQVFSSYKPINVLGGTAETPSLSPV